MRINPHSFPARGVCGAAQSWYLFGFGFVAVAGICFGIWSAGRSEGPSAAASEAELRVRRAGLADSSLGESESAADDDQTAPLPHSNFGERSEAEPNHPVGESDREAGRQRQIQAQRQEALEASQIARDFQSLSTPEQRMQYLAEILPTADRVNGAYLLAVAASDPSTDVRIDAISHTDLLLDSDQREALLADLLQDDDDRVRDVAFHKVGEREVAERVALLALVLESPNSATVEQALNQLSMYRTKESNIALINRALRSPSSGNASDLLSAVNRSLDANFSEITQAVDWWSKNADSYADDMSHLGNP